MRRFWSSGSGVPAVRVAAGSRFAVPECWRCGPHAGAPQCLNAL